MRLADRVRLRPCPTEFDSPEQDRPEATETDPDRAQLYLTEPDPRTNQTMYESYRVWMRLIGPELVNPTCTEIE